nr:hypothetical protein [Streptomyces sp. 846.5]
MVIEAKRASARDVASIIYEFYQSSAARASCSPPIRCVLLALAVLEGVFSVSRGVNIHCLVVRRNSRVVGGLLVGSRGTIFNASLRREFRHDQVFQQGIAVFDNYFKVDSWPRLAFWSSSPKLKEAASLLGFTPTGEFRSLRIIRFAKVRLPRIEKNPIDIKSGKPLEGMERK